MPVAMMTMKESRRSAGENKGGEGAADASPAGSSTRGPVRSSSLRRRKSKGTIAGFASGSSSSSERSSSVERKENSAVNGDGKNGGDNASSSAGATSGAQGPQHVGDSPNLPPARPCHSARMTQLCCENALQMGARTQLSLCPPGARKDLQSALRQSKARRKTTRSSSNLLKPLPLRRVSSVRSSTGIQSTAELEANAYYSVEKMIGGELAQYDDAEDALLNSATPLAGSMDEDDYTEDESSGDEDDLSNLEDLIEDISLMPSPTSLADLDLISKKYAKLREPLYTPAGTDPAAASTGAMGNWGSAKLPFNYRKLRWFDTVTAADRTTARAYIRKELRKAKKRDGAVLHRHLKRMQRRERRKVMQEKGFSGESKEDMQSDEESDDVFFTKMGIDNGVGLVDPPISPRISAALLLESLSLNPLESVEGMSKCYDGIVAAGVALLDSEAPDQTTLDLNDNKERPTRSEIMSALAPLLITSLEQSSGEVILYLARLRRMCGTARYQRRFVQRIAPCLIRPPKGAMWCLRHQTDMEPILAATEMIFDAAHDIFAAGWFDRGRLLLADSQRAETLHTAAMQLKRLSAAVPTDGLNLGLNTPGGAHGHRRGNSFLMGSTPTKDHASTATEPLAEWEVLAVDVQIRKSITNIFTKDWSKVVVVPPRDQDGHGSTRHRKGISHGGGGGGNRSTFSTDPSNSSEGVTSPSLPLSPPRSDGMRVPASPVASAPVEELTQSIESAFGPSFAAQQADVGSTVSGGSQMAGRRLADMLEPDSPGLSEGPKRGGTVTPPHTPIPQNISTPPRSPPSHSQSPGFGRDLSTRGTVSGQPLPSIDGFILQSAQGQLMSPPASPGGNRQPGHVDYRAPLSPSSASMEASRVAASDSSVRSNSNASVGSTGSGTTSSIAHYRMLTSTPAERKRTVAACRALRAQIGRFEEAFVQLHGRPPKGAAERAPLATTYAQYREWKRAIRADAACRIQALFRGFRIRWALLRSNNPRVRLCVESRSCRPGQYSSHRLHARGGKKGKVLEKLSIPAEIGGGGKSETNRKASIDLAPMPSSSIRPGMQAHPSHQESPSFGDEGNDASNMGVEVFISPQNSSGSASPSFAPSFTPSPTLSMPRRRASSSDRAKTSRDLPDMPGQQQSSFDGMTLPELQARKRELKQQLKQYDMNFAKQHGRMPVKAEKEPIRHLYESYNTLKTQITTIEREGPSPSGGPVAYRRSPSTMSVGSADSSGDDSPNSGTAPLAIRAKRKEKPASTRHADDISRTPDATPSSVPSGAPSNDLAALKAEKATLHQMLRSYEKDFYREHNRQVSSFADIRPVASQYRRYKEIKKAIASLQQSGQGGGVDS